METGETTIIPHDEPVSASSANASRVETVAHVDTSTFAVNTTSASLTQYTSLTDLCRKVPAVQYLLEEWHTEYDSDPERYWHLVHNWHHAQNNADSKHNSDPERTPNHIYSTLSPDHILPTDASLVLWKCRKGHEWQAPVARRAGKRKIGCPGCSGSSTYMKYKEMGCKKGFEHFHQGTYHVWRGGKV